MFFCLLCDRKMYNFLYKTLPHSKFIDMAIKYVHFQSCYVFILFYFFSFFFLWG